jgi:hypothetical protein
VWERRPSPRQAADGSQRYGISKYRACITVFSDDAPRPFSHCKLCKDLKLHVRAHFCSYNCQTDAYEEHKKLHALLSTDALTAQYPKSEQVIRHAAACIKTGAGKGPNRPVPSMVEAALSTL